jgi:hypothetical protein
VSFFEKNRKKNCIFSALPITIIVDNFVKVAQEEQQLEQIKAELIARREREWQRLLVVAAEAVTPVLNVGSGGRASIA